MNPALWAAKTGLDAQQTRLAVTSNNLANVSTSGFKKGRAVFEDLLYQNVRQVGGSTSQDTEAPSGVHLGTGVRVVATEKLYTQGGLTQTDNALDVAVEGRGFFQIQMPDGTNAYTRDGSFQLSAQGQMVTSSGYTLQPGISIPEGAQSVTIGRDGVVSVRVAGQAAPVQVGQLQLTDFVNPAGLQPLGENLLAETVASGPAQTGTPGQNGTRRHHAGLGRGLERQRGRRAGQHDRDAARLRDELEGDLDRRPDARVREQPVMRLTVDRHLLLSLVCSRAAAAAPCCRKTRAAISPPPGPMPKQAAGDHAGRYLPAGHGSAAVAERHRAQRGRHADHPARREHQRREDRQHHGASKSSEAEHRPGPRSSAGR